MDRPSSTFTTESLFADSAISVGASTSKIIHADDQVETESISSGFSQPNISDRLGSLAASAFAAEVDQSLDERREQKIWSALKIIEDCLEGRDQEVEEAAQAEVQKEENGLEDIQLHEIHASLAATVASMRKRQQEQRHLQKLTMEKLEAVAQTCIVQQKQVDDLDHEVQELRGENQKLGQENDTLREHVVDLESQATQKEVAVHAMSTAVAGLEGWISNSPGVDHYRTQSATQTPRRGRVIVRGQGRFRGRYFVDDPEGEVVFDGRDATSDARDLHDGVKSWLRGFRDVEEELHVASPPRVIRSKEVRSDLTSTDDEWGSFETVSAV